MKCRHRRWTKTFRNLDSGHTLEFLQCCACWTWLPLGPSDETPVDVEVRAAEIAVRAVANQDEFSMRTSFHEDVGWFIRMNWVTYGDAYARDPENAGEHAGYLAHAIANHDEETAP